jgi:hypothetical protein
MVDAVEDVGGDEGNCFLKRQMKDGVAHKQCVSGGATTPPGPGPSPSPPGSV